METFAKCPSAEHFNVLLTWKDCICRVAPVGSRDASALSRALLSACASDRGSDSGVEPIGHHSSGQPCFPTRPELYASISTCSGWAAAVTSTVPVGIDIEVRAVYDPDFMRAVCTDAEWERIKNSGDPNKNFCRLWTEKESVLKCSGAGLCSTSQLRGALDDGNYETKTWELDVTVTIARRKDC